MREAKDGAMKCPEVYAGPTFPGFHGTKCRLGRDHDGMHAGRSHVGGELSWYSPAQKLAIGALNRAGRIQ